MSCLILKLAACLCIYSFWPCLLLPKKPLEHFIIGHPMSCFLSEFMWEGEPWGEMVLVWLLFIYLISAAQRGTTATKPGKLCGYVRKKVSNTRTFSKLSENQWIVGFWLVTLTSWHPQIILKFLYVFKYLIKQTELFHMSQRSSRKLQMVGMEETSVKNEVWAGVREIAVLVPSKTPKGGHKPWLLLDEGRKATELLDPVRGRLRDKGPPVTS